MSNYVVYHLHSYYSLLDSCTSPKEYVEKAKELGQTALCFTEHGNIFNWFEKKKLCEENGIKYLHGIECYLTQSHENKVRDNYHTILIAKNQDGFKEINNLFFASYAKDHTYYKHRLSIEEFLKISDNVIKISACLQSPLWKMKDSDCYEGVAKHYDYYEIQYHNDPDQIAFNKQLYEMSKKYDKPLIAGTDTHSLNSYKAECRTVLQYGKTDGSWDDGENSCDLTYKSYEELVEAFEIQGSLPKDVILEAINNTNIMADSTEEIVVDTHNKYPFLYGDDDEKVLWDVLKKNYKQKLKDGIITDDKEYIDKIKEEMAVFKKVDMIGFMLFMSEMMTWAKDNEIAVGSGRGSVAGSMVAFISNITDVDPIKWKTVFSRFCNEHRVEIGDVDLDFWEDDRQKIYDYIINRFGTERTGYVLALGTLADKAVIDTIGKAFRIKHKENTQYTLEKIKEIKKEYEDNPEETRKRYKDLFYYYDGLVGCVISQSQHPAGIIASPINLIDFCGAFIGESGQQILPLDMDCCHDTGLVKYDILGLKTVGVIDKTCKLLGKKYPRVHEINFDDEAVYDDMTADHTAIFQFESKFAGDCLKRMGCKNVFDLSLVNACIRPSGESYRDKLLDRIPNKNPSELIDKLLENNYGWLIYQEDTIAFLQQICGFTGSDADNVRRAIGRKKVDELNKALPKILDGYCSKSDKPREVAEEEARQFLKIIEDASSYQFGYNHSIAYSIMSYLCGYFRHYYPVEFCTSFLNCAKNDDDISNGTELVKSLDIKMAPIKFRHSGSIYECDSSKRVIYKGISSIKSMGNSAGDELYALRNNTYDTFIDLLEDIRSKTTINSKQLDILIKLNFFSEFGYIEELLQQVEMYNMISGKKQIKLGSTEIPEYLIHKHCKKITDKTAKDFDWKELLKDWASHVDKPKKNSVLRLRYEFDLLGYCQTTFPTVASNIYMCTCIATEKSNIFEFYGLKYGETMRIKCRKKTWQLNPIEIGDTVVIKETKWEKKWGKDQDGNWIRKDEEEEILTNYQILY